MTNDRLSIIESLETFIPQDQPSIDFDIIYPTCRILNLLTVQDIMQLNSIAKDKKLAGKPKEKQNRIKQLMMMRGFKKLAAGTNRLVFKYMEDQSFVIKVPFNSVGLRDNLDELYNQQFLKPFCTKVFEVSPCGTVGMFERVHGITNREEFQVVSGTIFDIIINKFIGEFVLADFGTKFFMNWGIRKHTYPVLLDFPYLYELDGAKLYCNRPDPLSEYGFCGGEIDYDSGFNHLVCKKCGKTYLASELRLSESKKTKSILIEREDIGMIVTISRGNKVIYEKDTTKESDTYRRDKKGRKKETPLEYRERKKCEGFTVNIGKVAVETSDDAQQTEPVVEQQDVTEEKFNHGYSLNSIPNDINEIYRTTAVINKPKKDDEKQKIQDTVKGLKHIEEQSKDGNPVVTATSDTTEDNENIQVAEPVSVEMYEMAQTIHEVNNQESVPEEDEQEHESTDEKDLGADFDQDCNTNLGDLLKDVSVKEDNIGEEEVARPANKEVVIISRDDDEKLLEAVTISEPNKTYGKPVKLQEGEIIESEEPVYSSGSTKHIDESYYD